MRAFPLLDRIDGPEDLRKLPPASLPDLSRELREYLCSVPSVKRAHLMSSLGVAELTIAIHYLFDTPDDRLIWDVGHQAYVHKVLTQRKKEFEKIRLRGGISGFPSKRESPYDTFGTGHSSTSLSALMGMAAGDQLKEVKRKYVAVIGDGALTAGMAFEALNHMGKLKSDILIILNDNGISIDPNTGFLHQSQNYPKFFDALGIDYSGPVDGHNIDELLQSLRPLLERNGPQVLHVKTEHGKGWIPPASTVSSPAEKRSFQDAIAAEMIRLAEKDEKVVLVSPAMLSGGSFAEFAQRFPDRCFDTGIAEQHAVTFCAGLAAEGMKPFCHLYATFAQRAIDQIVHDVALQNLPVRFLIDRAGIAGEDGPTHQGTLDINILRGIPGITLAAPADEPDVKAFMTEASEAKKPFFVRYPKAPLSPELPGGREKGKAHLIQGGKGRKAVIFSGPLHAYPPLSELPGDNAFTLLNLRYLKPLDRESLLGIFASHSEIIVLEECNREGGTGEQLHALANESDFRGQLHTISLPDEFIPHGTRDELLYEFLFKNF